MAVTPRKSGRESSPYRQLHNGDHMSQAEFHRAYEAMPESYRAELIAGIVYEPSPLGWPHGKLHLRLGALLSAYVARTKGLEAADNATAILGKEDEVQPDLVLRVSPSYRGRSRNTRDRKARDQYVKGAPELVAEVAHSSRAIDLHVKKDRYDFAGVLEYIVVCVEPEQLRWFDLPGHRELAAAASGVLRSSIFPGLWIDRDALFEPEYDRLMETLTLGLRSPEHREFAAKLDGQAL